LITNVINKITSKRYEENVKKIQQSDLKTCSKLTSVPRKRKFNEIERFLEVSNSNSILNPFDFADFFKTNFRWFFCYARLKRDHIFIRTLRKRLKLVPCENISRVLDTS
jgi:hypothetical protein